MTDSQRKKNQQIQTSNDPGVSFQTEIFKAAIIMMLHKIKVKTFEMNGKIVVLSRHTESMKKNQMEILDLKNAVSEIKNLLDILIIRMEKTEKRVNEPEDKSIKIGHPKEQKK